MSSRLAAVFALACAIPLLWGSWRDPGFWRSAEQRGDRLLAAGEYAAAAATYEDPWRIGMAQYRNGDFEEAAHTFARVPGASGAYNQGNAWLMRGDYDAAIASYERALAARPDWPLARDNRALAELRKQRLEDAGNDRAQDDNATFKPDEIRFDNKAGNSDGKPVELNDASLSDAALRATWLRRVQTTPADFLRVKFAYQAAQATQGEPAP
ncbi:tetratricopeptide repeat protein [Mangrovimicrobium sediminis]|uniref:Tetratricopeptide repeat protein n=1 Tax=Mangrovimicrobium sediminis TaxID=2562682 RepID=A0A4Z0M1I2_9GAMM|nr:tetratricopeptide repeat protein [Haliea sp. SAOS-164]TGD73462.1 tetratricopeptide repeat protein [Haliea sp. SAOS-164]